MSSLISLDVNEHYWACNGGGIGCSNSCLITSIDNNSLTNNAALSPCGLGGGIYLNGKSGSNIPYITNVTFANNKAGNGGAVYCFNNSDPSFRNCVFWGNTATIGAQVFLFDEPSDPAFFNNDVQGGLVAIEPNGIFFTGTYTNNINADPMFVAPSSGTDSTNYYGTYNWTLQAASPCINTGDQSWPSYPATDLAGAARIFAGLIDIGAYEYHHMSLSVSQTPVSCHGGSNGTATVNPSGYAPPCTFSWSPSGQITQTATGLAAGVHTVTVTDATGDTATASITISQPLAINVNAGTNSTICTGSTITIGGSPTASGGAGSFTYSWIPSSGLSSATIPNPTATPASTTSYTVIVTDGGGCTNSASVTVTVIPQSGVAATPSGTTNLCQDSPNASYTTTGATNATSYLWNLTPSGAGTITGTGTTATVNWNDTYTGSAQITVNGINACGSGTLSNPITVTINPLPTVSVNAIPNFINYGAVAVTLSGNPTGGTFTVDGVSTITFNPAAAGLGTHQIIYNYTDGNSCSNSSVISTIVYDTTGVLCTSYDTVYISVTDTLIINAVLTGINPPNNINTIKVYPNPAQTHIYINTGNYASMAGYTIRIDNSLAQVVFQSIINQQQFYVDLSTWSGNGTYFVYIIDDQSNIIDVRKIILQ